MRRWFQSVPSAGMKEEEREWGRRGGTGQEHDPTDHPLILPHPVMLEEANLLGSPVF